MADERDFELLDDYLTNRMSDHDRSAFEQRLKADPDLQHEHALQRRLIQGIRDVRVSELKSMLNNVPVPSGNTGNTLGTKIILGAVVSLVVVTAAILYFRDDQPERSGGNIQMEEQAPAQEPLEPEMQPEEDILPQESTEVEQESAETDKNQTSAGTEQSKPSLAKRPTPLSAPAEKKRNNGREGPLRSDKDSSSRNVPENDGGAVLTPGNSALSVAIDSNNARHSFHYQFQGEKLLLFGPFSENEYQISELRTNGRRSIFLSYNNRYYALEEQDEQVKPLTPVTDQALIKKLKEIRN